MWRFRLGLDGIGVMVVVVRFVGPFEVNGVVCFAPCCDVEFSTLKAIDRVAGCR